jgi:hypothetical protein
VIQAESGLEGLDHGGGILVLKPFVKGQSGDKSGRPKDLGRCGEILMKEFDKTGAANIGGKRVKKDPGRDRGAGDVKSAILTGRPRC